MTTWRDLVLLHFRPPAAHLSLVADPDGLLLEEQVLAALGALGYDLLTFADPIAFRYLYERRYRDQPAPALIVRTDHADVRRLPYDLLRGGRQLSLTLHDLCPQPSYPVVRDFFRAAPDLLDVLLDAGRAAQGERLSEQRSLWFLARHVYGLDPASLARLDDLVERLLHIHYHGWALLAVLPTRPGWSGSRRRGYGAVPDAAQREGRQAALRLLLRSDQTRALRLAGGSSQQQGQSAVCQSGNTLRRSPDRSGSPRDAETPEAQGKSEGAGEPALVPAWIRA